jgi:non-heme chloroperoxidase
MAYVTTRDGTQIFYKDWGTGRPIVFSHGWPLTADEWDPQMIFFASRGFRVIAHDRRGHGRSQQTWDGNEMDTYADDLAALVTALDLRDAIHVGHSTGGGEVVRTLGRHGTDRAARAVLIGAVPPLMLKTPENPEGTPRAAFDDLRKRLLADRSQLYREIPIPFYGANRTGSQVSQGLLDKWWLQGMMGGSKPQLDCIAAYSETDFTQDLKRIRIPVLVLHGDDDQIVPIGAAAPKSAKLLEQATLKVYPGAPHGMAATLADRVNEEILAFLEA